MKLASEQYKLEFKIIVSGELHPKIEGIISCDVIVDDGREHNENEEGYIVEPIPRFGCTAIGPLNRINANGKFSSFYWIHLLGADPSAVPVPSLVALHVQIAPGDWKSKSYKVFPNMVQNKNENEMHLNLGKIEWVATE